MSLNSHPAGFCSVNFVPVSLDDAALILELRAPGVAKGHLKRGAETVEQQRQWLANYACRAEPTNDSYYMIRQGQAKIGTLRIVGITDPTPSFSWGSWCMKDGCHPRSVVSACLLAYEVGFSTNWKADARFEVHQKNASVLFFHRRMGAEEIGSIGDQIRFLITRESFHAARDQMVRTLKLA